MDLHDDTLRLILSKKNRAPLNQLCKKGLEDCSEVLAAVAYISDERTLLEPCWKRKIPLKIWARVDDTIPVRPGILRWMLNKTDIITCRLLHGGFHTKIYWWKGYGVYVGSANLSLSAWFENFEAGAFYSEYALDELEMRDQLEEYFELIDNAATSLTEEVVEEQEALAKKRHEFEKQYRDSHGPLRIPKMKSLTAIPQRGDRKEKKKSAFLKEWDETLQLLRNLGKEVSREENRPPWLKDTVPGNLIADQFLHSYYYRHVMDGRTSKFHELHYENAGKAKVVREKFLQEWASMAEPDKREDLHLHEWAEIVRRLASKGRLRKLTKDEFQQLMSHLHSFIMVARQASHISLGLPEEPEKMTIPERSDLVSGFLYNRKNEQGETVCEFLDWVLWGGPPAETPYRIYDGAYEPSRKIRQIGLSTLGELVGWAMPEHFVPRNDRTNKALRAMGYDVKVHSG